MLIFFNFEYHKSLIIVCAFKAILCSGIVGVKLKAEVEKLELYFTW